MLFLTYQPAQDEDIRNSVLSEIHSYHKSPAIRNSQLPEISSYQKPPAISIPETRQRNRVKKRNMSRNRHKMEVNRRPVFDRHKIYDFSFLEALANTTKE